MEALERAKIRLYDVHAMPVQSTKTETLAYYVLQDLIAAVESLEEQSKAGPRTTESPTKDSPSDADGWSDFRVNLRAKFPSLTNGMADAITTWVRETLRPLLTASITPSTPASPPSDPQDTPSGLAGHAFWCVAPDWLALRPPGQWQMAPFHWWCPSCGALKSPDRTLVPAAAPTSSTSLKPDTSLSAATEAAPAESRSKRCTRPSGCLCFYSSLFTRETCGWWKLPESPSSESGVLNSDWRGVQ